MLSLSLSPVVTVSSPTGAAEEGGLAEGVRSFETMRSLLPRFVVALATGSGLRPYSLQ